jgi:hypothetical protein
LAEREREERKKKERRRRRVLLPNSLLLSAVFFASASVLENSHFPKRVVDGFAFWEEEGRRREGGGQF